MAIMAPSFAWLALLFLSPATASIVESVRKRKLLDRQEGIETIRSLSWREFEELLAEAYRRQGYEVLANNSAGPDGETDIEIQKEGNLYLVQCKQWKNVKVGVKEVREMFGIMTAEKASGCVIVTSGMFTQEARNFAEGKPIDLAEGQQLVYMIRNIQGAPSVATSVAPASDGRICPACGRPLVIREAKRGNNAGSQFWGCTGFPRCRFTESIDIRSHMGKAGGAEED